MRGGRGALGCDDEQALSSNTPGNAIHVIIFGMVFYWRLRRAGSITMRKTTMVLMGIALIAVAGTELGWW